MVNNSLIYQQYDCLSHHIIDKRPRHIDGHPGFVFGNNNSQVKEVSGISTLPSW